MTTIAYTRGVIAADTGMCIGDTKTGEARKIAKSDKGLAGGAGHASWVYQFLDWFERGERGKPPGGVSDDSAVDRGMVVRPGNLCIIEITEPEGSFLIEADYYALGTGRECALGVMFHGGDALDAVRASMRHNTETWGDLQSLTIGGPKHGRHRTHPPRLNRQDKGAGSGKAKKGTANR